MFFSPEIVRWVAPLAGFLGNQGCNVARGFLFAPLRCSQSVTPLQLNSSTPEGKNQRLALYDGILIKENHIAAAGSIKAAMNAAHSLKAGVSIQIEVENLDELKQAIDAGATSILIDNFSNDMMLEAVAMTAGRAVLEASGGVNRDSVQAIAETGVDRISIGALTKDLRATDYSLRVIS